MKIATWNIGSGFVMQDGKKYDHEELSYFIQGLKEVNADVICLQEVDTDPENPTQSHAHEIARALDMTEVAVHVMHPNHLKSGQLLSVALLSRFPILSKEYIQVMNPQIVATGPDGAQWTSFDKGFLFCDIEVNGESIRVASGHLLPFQKFKRDHLAPEFAGVRKSIEDALLNAYDKPIIIGADMNFGPIEQLIPGVFEHGFQDLFQVDTTPDQAQRDHIILSKEFTATQWQVVPGKADHYLCVVEIEA